MRRGRRETKEGMKSGVAVFVVVFIVLAALHQDQWNWDSAKLVFGFMPIGLAYHAGYSIVAAIFWCLVIQLAWPSRLEEWANEGKREEKVKGD